MDYTQKPFNLTEADLAWVEQTFVLCFNTAGVHVEFTAYDSFHNSLLIVRS